ncbi:restriction endonuclease subunit S [Melaminivora sp.]
MLYTTVGSFGIPVPVVQQQRFCFQRHIALLRPAVVDLQSYLALALRTTLAFAQAEKGATGTAQKTVPLSVLRNLILPLPPLAEQSRIVTRVESLMRLCDALEEKGRLQATQHAQLVSTLLGTLTASTTPEERADHWQRVAQHFDLLLDRPEAITALEQTILQLAVRGLLVPQDPTDEPASALLQKIRAEKDRLIATGQIKQGKPLPPITDEEKPFGLPVGWEWVRINDLAEVQGGIQKTQLRRPIQQHFPYLRVANVQRDALLLKEIERFELTLDELEKWRLITGDLLIVEGNGSADEIGRCAVWDGSIDPCVYQNHLIRMRCFQQATMVFAKLFLNSPSGMGEMKHLAITTSGLYSLSVGKIRNFAIPLPPLAEQSRIVARVTELRRLCADLRQRLAERQCVQVRLAEALVQAAC